jgi:histone H3/H4
MTRSDQTKTSSADAAAAAAGKGKKKTERLVEDGQKIGHTKKRGRSMRRTVCMSMRKLQRTKKNIIPKAALIRQLCALAQDFVPNARFGESSKDAFMAFMEFYGARVASVAKDLTLARKKLRVTEADVKIAIRIVRGYA